MSALSLNSPTAYSFSGGVLDQYLVNVNLAASETVLNAEFKALRAQQDLQSGNLTSLAALRARNTISSAYSTATSAIAASENLEFFGAKSVSASPNGQVSISSSGYGSLIQTANAGDSTGYLAHLIAASATPVESAPLILNVTA